MKRLMRLGLTTLAALAFTAALGGASASASWIVSESSTITGTPTSAKYSSPRGEIQCKGAAFTAYSPGRFQYVETSVLKEASGGNCISFSVSKPMDYHGCVMKLRPGAEIAPGEFEGKIEIGPAGCGPYTWERSPGCYESFAQPASVPATFYNYGSGSTAKVHVSVASTMQDTYTCGGSKTSSSYSWEWDLTSASGVQIAAQEGLYIEGAAPTQPKLATEIYPASISGSVTKNLVITAAGGTIECGGTIPKTAFNAATATPVFGFNLTNCKAFGFSKAVVKGTCWFSMPIANAGPPYSGALNLECLGGGLSFVPQSFGVDVCTITFAPQTLGTVALQNLGAGTTRTVAGAVSGSGLKYTSTGGACGPKEGGTATLSMSFELSARF